MIRIDEEFKNLIPALSADERNGLEESLRYSLLLR